MNICDRQALALRKNALPLLRTLGVKDVTEYEPHTLSWDALNKHRNEILRHGRANADKLANGKDEAENRDLEDAHLAIQELLDAVEGEKDERRRADNNGPREHSHTKADEERAARRPTGPATASGADGGPYGEPEKTVYALRRDQRMADWVKENGRVKDYGELSEGAYMRAMVLGAKSDIEKRALSEGSDSAGGFNVPEILSARIIDRMRPASVVMQAGAQTVPLGSDVNYVAKVATDPTPAWRNEGAAFAEGDPTFARVTLTPRSLGIVCKVSIELLQDSLNIEETLPNLLATSLGQELDRVALLGSGTAPEPQGIVNFSGLTSNAFGGGALSSYTPLIQARTALRTANSDAMAYIMSPRDDGTFASLTATDDQPLMKPAAISDTPMLVTSKMPTDGGVGTNESQIIAGDFTKLIVGIRTEITIGILKERYMPDAGQYGFVAMLRADIAAEHEAAFTVLDAITP